MPFFGGRSLLMARDPFCRREISFVGGRSLLSAGDPSLLSVSVWVSAKFGTCTGVSLNGTLIEDKLRTFTHFIFNKCPIYTHDGASVKFSTNSHATDYIAFVGGRPFCWREIPFVGGRSLLLAGDLFCWREIPFVNLTLILSIAM